MIRLKLTFESDKGSEHKALSVNEEELLSSAIRRVTEGIPLGEFTHEETFSAFVNGNKIDPELWKSVKLLETDDVFIVPTLSGGDFGQIFKQIVIIAATITAGAFAGPLFGAGTIAAGAFTAGVTIVTGLLMNALIPPPQPNLGSTPEADSQMYSLNGQSNEPRRGKTVPKVYGIHRFVPPLAANPYTELAIDPVTGETVQWYVAIYDFGLGTPQISDIKIGNTPLDTDSFTEFSYRLVDPNVPEAPLDDMDDVLNSEFELYRGDHSVTQLSLNLNDDGDSQIQNSEPNTDGVPQEIELNFVCPGGLFGINSSGAVGSRRINLQVEFAPVDTNDWVSFNDPTKVLSYDMVGGQDISKFSSPVAGLAITHDLFDDYYLSWKTDPSQIDSLASYIIRLKFGQNKILVSTSSASVHEVGDTVQWSSGKFIGTITAITQLAPPNQAYTKLTLAANISKNTFKDTFAYQTLGPGNVLNRNLLNFIKPAGTGGMSIKGDKRVPVYSQVRFTPNDPGEYRVRVTRTSTSGTYVTSVADDLQWAGITTKFNRAPINTKKRHVFMELRIKATDQLNGNIQDLNALVSQPVEVYDPDTETWSRQITNNPAWIFADLMISEVNKRAISKDRLHLESLLAWAAYCEQVPTPPPEQTYTDPRFQCNFILDYNATLQEVLAQVSTAAQASLNIIDGKYGVLLDRFKDLPVQLFTQRNSKNFSSNRNYTRQPNAVSVSFIDPNKNWEQSEVVVYENGFNEDNSEEVDELRAFACTSFEQAWRYGRYMVAQNKLRQETIQITVDFENLVCTRGDYVKLAHDVMKLGGRPARVKEVVGNQVTIDDGLDADAPISWGFTFRSAVNGIVTDTATPVNPRVFDLDGSIFPEVGDLIVIGEVGQLTLDCVVKSINPNENMEATLTLVERANAIFEYESTSELPEYDPQISQVYGSDFYPPKAVIDLDLVGDGVQWTFNGSGYDYFAEVTWDMPPGSIFELFEVYLNDQSGYRSIGTTRAKKFNVPLNVERIDLTHGIKVLAVSSSGKKLILAAAPEVTFMFSAKSILPQDVEGFSVQLSNNTIQFHWQFVADADISHYEIRFSPDIEDTWESSNFLSQVPGTLNTSGAQARNGIYFIKAVDYEGNKSAHATEEITSVPDLLGVELIAFAEDAPDFLGEKENLELLGDGSILNIAVPGDEDTMQFYPEGIYYFENFVDIEEIYTVRLQNMIRADGFRFGELMYLTENLEDLENMGSTTTDEWDVILEYRTAKDLSFMVDTINLEDLESMLAGGDEDFTPWRPVPASGDVTGRFFQFRIRLRSYTPNVSPRLFSTLVRLVMPFRSEVFQNVLSDDTDPVAVTYVAGFYGPDTSPNIQVSIDDGQSGDYWEFTSRTLEGFAIKIYDRDDIQVARQFDAVATGFGVKHGDVI